MSFSIFPSHFHWHCVVGARNRKREIISLWRNGGIRSSCAALSSWVRGGERMTNVKSGWRRVIQWSRTARRWDKTERGRVGREEKKKWWCLLFHPPLYSSRHGNMPVGHSREASSLTKTTERQRVSESKREQTRQTVCMNESWERK